MGPESTGKSACAARLAQELKTAWVPEYAKSLIMANGGSFAWDDAMAAARGQIDSEKTALWATGPLMALDTDPLTTLAWTLTLFGAAPPELDDLVKAYPKPDATILFDPSVAWEPGVHRGVRAGSGSQEERQKFFELCAELLARHGRAFEVASGTHGERFALAKERALRLIKSGTRSPSPIWALEGESYRTATARRDKFFG